jgi:ribosomal protein S18 acetylase RimI-like enzyme
MSPAALHHWRICVKLVERRMSVTIVTRAATPEDTRFLWRILTLAASMAGTDADIESAQRDPNLRCYVDDYGRPGDTGVIAAIDGVSVGAAWVRLSPGEEQPSKVWTSEIPELAIATLPDRRGAGIGSVLMTALVEAARDRYPAIVLTVREGNAAVRLYERFGFVVERRVVNRVGGVSLAMRCDFERRR